MCGFLVDGGQKEASHRGAKMQREEKNAAPPRFGARIKKVKCTFQQLFRAPLFFLEGVEIAALRYSYRS